MWQFLLGLAILGAIFWATRGKAKKDEEEERGATEPGTPRKTQTPMPSARLSTQSAKKKRSPRAQGTSSAAQRANERAKANGMA